MKRRCWIALLAVATAASAETKSEIADDTDLPVWAVEKITPMHDSVSNWITNNSRNIDSFFGTGRQPAC